MNGNLSLMSHNDLATEARVWMKGNKMDVGDRGRVSRDALVAFLMSNPRRAREYAKMLGVTIPRYARIDRMISMQIVLGREAMIRRQAS